MVTAALAAIFPETIAQWPAIVIVHLTVRGAHAAGPYRVLLATVRLLLRVLGTRVARKH